MHVFTCRHWVSAMLIEIYVTLLVSCFDWQIFFYSGGLGANLNMSRELGINKFSVAKVLVLLLQFLDSVFFYGPFLCGILLIRLSGNMLLRI